MSDITRHRGDTRRIQRTVKENGVAIPITDWTFLLTISREEDPVDTVEQIAQIIGVITDAANGVVDFTPLAKDVDWVGGNFFDIEAVDSDGGISTLDKGQFTLLQDITKDPETRVYLFEGTLDELLPNDGPLWIVSADESSPARSDATLPGYRVYDTRDVVNLNAKPAEVRVTDGYTTSLHLAGSLAPSFMGNVDMMVVFYWHSIASTNFTIGLMAGPHDLAWGLVAKLKDTISLEFTLYRGDGITAGGFDYGGRVHGYAWEEGEAMADGTGWHRMRLQLDRTASVVRLKRWLDVDDEPMFWNFEHNDANLSTLSRLYPMISSDWPLTGAGGQAYVESVTIEEF